MLYTDVFFYREKCSLQLVIELLVKLRSYIIFRLFGTRLESEPPGR